ncbi:S9 family peptidase [Natronosporangium hydrolyticum]|uniref:S9 family peptidase n=1 Tax=Natronosporangium hydrolyticum TaxID=2811111 RepID=A0A895YNW0_9ACTN|nr:S9 family peptidase [Natronosporangium hydrolyticum]QSB16396.1 S9 family peptidase [Natronosporangium hydrolyticum]
MSDAPRPPRFEQFFAVRRFQPTLAFTAAGDGLLFSTNISGQFNLWRLPVTGGWPHQLTSFEDHTVRGIAPAPDGSTVLFAADHDGDEFHQLYAVDPDGGWPVAWTEAWQVQHLLGDGAWHPDGRRVVYSANSQTPTAMDVWLRDTDSGEVRKLFGTGRFCVPAGFSPDGASLVCVEMLANDHHQLHVVELETGEARLVTDHTEPTKFYPGPWAADGSGLWVRTDLGRDFTGLAFLDLATGKLEWVATPEWDVEEVAADDAGTVLLWLVNEDGWGRIYGRDLRTGEDLPAADLPPGCGTIFGTGLTVSPDGQRAALLWSQPRRAQELYLLTLATGEATRLTDNMLGGLAPEQLVAPSLIRYRSADELDVPAWVYRPDRPGRLPVVLSIHGGPEAQERPLYAGLYQYLCSRGIAVVATNIRGSTGYGTSYQRLIHRDWGGGDLADWEHAVRWLHAQDWVDPDRIGVYGGSYGGFATLSCVTRLPQYWAAAVDIVGPSNLVSFTKAVPPTWRALMARWVGDPETEADFLMERSPISYVDNVRTPLLVIQGAQDPRVVKGESDQMVARLQELGREVEYVVFDDEGHGFTRRSNEVRAMRLTADWFTDRLAGDS